MTCCFPGQVGADPFTCTTTVILDWMKKWEVKGLWAWWRFYKLFTVCWSLRIIDVNNTVWIQWLVLDIGWMTRLGNSDFILQEVEISWCGTPQAMLGVWILHKRDYGNVTHYKIMRLSPLLHSCWEVWCWKPSWRTKRITRAFIPLCLTVAINSEQTPAGGGWWRIYFNAFFEKRLPRTKGKYLPQGWAKRNAYPLHKDTQQTSFHANKSAETTY